MAGDWIKLQKDTPDKPEVLAIASRLGLDPDAVVGKLVRIWCWFDTHTVDGNASCVTFSFLDRITGVTGFAEQVELVGWLTQSGHDLYLPNFDYHNGETAKRRALGKNRVEKARSNANGNASCVTKPLPEKRREEKSNKDTHAPDGFDVFWETYPKKVGKPAALKAYKSAKINGALSTVLDDVREKTGTEAWTKAKGQFIPNPATYLNQRRWEDFVQETNFFAGGF